MSEKTIKTDVKVSPDELKVLGETVLKQFPNGITLESLFEAVTSFMSIVGQIKNMRGADKKQLVIDTILFVLDNTNAGALEIVEPVVKQMIPYAIDSLIDVEKGTMRFNPKVKNKLQSCFPCCK